MSHRLKDVCFLSVDPCTWFTSPLWVSTGAMGKWSSHIVMYFYIKHKYIFETLWHRHGDSMDVHREKRAAKLMTPAIYDNIRKNLSKCGWPQHDILEIKVCKHVTLSHNFIWPLYFWFLQAFAQLPGYECSHINPKVIKKNLTLSADGISMLCLLVVVKSLRENPHAWG